MGNDHRRWLSVNDVHLPCRPSIHIRPTNVNIFEGQSHTITCSVSSIVDITDITWIKVTAVDYEIVNVVGVDGKFSGGTLSDPSLTINNIVKSDEGTYVCRATNCCGTTSSEYSILKVKECIEVEIIQKGPIAVGYGGTIRINAKIISNSTGSLKVNWQKTHDNCSTALRIDCLKYSGSSCNVNNPELVINNVDIEDAGIYKLEVTSPTETISSPGILLELFGDEVDSLSKEGNNFFRLYILCLKIATQAVRDFFDRNVHVPGLDSFLKQHKTDLFINKDYRCTKEQKEKLFPGGLVAVDSADFDFALLYKLIRNCVAAIPIPTCGWGNQPLHGHLNETDHIERIRHLRNILVHNSIFEIRETEFSAYWTDLSEAINILSKGSLSTDVESMRTKKLDKCIINEMEKDIRKELKEIRQKIHSIDTRHIPLHIKKGHIESIKKWRLEDKLFYDETGGFTAALKMVQSKNYMTIIGGPGLGKTATARHIALQLEEQGWEVVPVCELKDIIDYGDRDVKQVFLLDDVLGIFALDMNIYHRIINHKEPIFKAIGGTSKLLFTCRKSVYKESFKLGLFVTENVIDLQSKDNQLTETEKMAICQYHCKAQDVNPDLYTSLSFTKANHMFPYLCKIFSMEKKYQQLGESFFNKPLEYFIIELDKLQHTNTIQYAVLVLCLVNGKLSVERLPHKRMQEEVFDNCGVNLGTPGKQIKDAIYHMSETYFTKLDTEYTFTHDFIYEVVAYHYGCQNQHHILKYLSSSYIANKVTVYEQASNEDHCIQISEDMYLPLAERLYTDIQSMNLFDVFMNKSLKHGPFRDVFEGMLKRKPFDEFESLILRKRENIRHFAQETLSGSIHIQAESDLTELMRLYLLFDKNSDPEHNVRVISWIINYGHTHLLQEIINHVKYNDHSISLIFGSNVIENTRLLALGCYSNNLDMVELILEYVDPKCIDMDYDAFSNIERKILRWYTPLTAACAAGNLCIVKALLRNKTEINKCYNDTKESPLCVAIRHRHVDVVRCLLSSGAVVNLCRVCGDSPLSIASQSGFCDIVKDLVAHNADVNLCNVFGHSPLFIASRLGHCDIVKYLVAANVDVNLCDRFRLRQSPLFIASKNGHCDIVKYLIAHNANVNLCDVYGQSPVLKASEEGHCDIVKYLIAHNADVNWCDRFGQSPVLKASEEGNCDIVKDLVAHNADVNFVCNRDGHSPLFRASQSGHCDIVKYLVAHNADVNLTDEYNRSPLYSAAEMGHYDIVLFLLQNGADVNISDDDNKLPLHVTSFSEHSDIVNLLITHGALSAGSEAIDIPKVQEGKENTTFTREQGETEEIIYMRETKEEKEEIIYTRETKEEKEEFVNTRNGEEQLEEVNDLPILSMSFGGDAVLPNVDNMSPLSIAVQKRQFDTVKNIIENSTDFDLSDTGKSPLFLAAEEGDHDIVALLLHSKYNDITKTYLETTPLEIAVWRNNTKVVQLLIQEENKLQKYQGNYHLFEILTDLKRSEVCINEQTGKEDCQTQDRNHRHLPYPLWHIITASNNYYLTHLLKIGLDINKRDYNGNTLFYKILNRTRWTLVDKFKSLMEHFEDVNVGGNKWISLLEMKRGQVLHLEYISMLMPNVTTSTVSICNETLSEFRKHVRRNSI